jgi:hypothetical protein
MRDMNYMHEQLKSRPEMKKFMLQFNKLLIGATVQQIREVLFYIENYILPNSVFYDNKDYCDYPIITLSGTVQPTKDSTIKDHRQTPD